MMQKIKIIRIPRILRIIEMIRTNTHMYIHTYLHNKYILCTGLGLLIGRSGKGGRVATLARARHVFVMKICMYIWVYISISISISTIWSKERERGCG
jgi:hypothetical protein